MVRGKSTLTKLLLGLYQPVEGNIWFCGKPLNSYSSKEILEKVSTFFQDSNIFLIHYAKMLHTEI